MKTIGCESACGGTSVDQLISTYPTEVVWRCTPMFGRTSQARSTPSSDPLGTSILAKALLNDDPMTGSRVLIRTSAMSILGCLIIAIANGASNYAVIGLGLAILVAGPAYGFY